MMKSWLVVIGNGMAPGRALERALACVATGTYDITISQRRAAGKLRSDHAVSGTLGEKILRRNRHPWRRMVVRPAVWINLYKGVAITGIDRANKTVSTSTGETFAYDKLIIATGSRPIVIPVPGAELAGVLTYRDLDDVEAMLLAAKSRGRAVVIGGGLLGLRGSLGVKNRVWTSRLCTLCQP